MYEEAIEILEREMTGVRDSDYNKAASVAIALMRAASRASVRRGSFDDEAVRALLSAIAAHGRGECGFGAAMDAAQRVRESEGK